MATASYDKQGIQVPESIKYSPVVISAEQVTPAGYESIIPSILQPLILSPSLFTRRADTTSSILDTVPKHFEKGGIQLGYYTSDEYQIVVDYQRTFSEQIRPTDDVLGEANIDDDQTAFINKARIDTTYTLETFEPLILYKRLYNNHTNLSESSTAQFTKVKQDTVGHTDILQSLDTTKAATDTINTAENTSFVSIKETPPDTFSADDSQTVFLDRQADFDSISTSDLINRKSEYYRLYADFVVATDDVLGQANVDDDQTAFVNKIRYDTYNISESVYTQAIFARYIEETQFTTDLSYVTSRKLQTDALNLQETHVADISKPLIGLTAQLSDEYYRSVNFTRSFVEDPKVADAAAYSIQSVPLETVLTNETRTANIQDYIVPGYVQVGYVGTDLTL